MKFFDGNIESIHNIHEVFGFFECKINAPISIEQPILQTKVKIGGGLRTIAPKGTWTDWLFSEEIKNSRKKGYSITISKGYLFEKSNIFKEYIHDLSEIKKNKMFIRMYYYELKFI